MISFGGGYTAGESGGAGGEPVGPRGMSAPRSLRTKLVTADGREVFRRCRPGRDAVTAWRSTAAAT
jgi:hypothetical protein